MNLYEIVDALRKRLVTAEAIVVALASSHPAIDALLEKLNAWVEPPKPLAPGEYVRELAYFERDRVLLHWSNVLGLVEQSKESLGRCY